MDAADKFVNNKAPLRFVLTFVLVLAAALAAAWLCSSRAADAIVSGQIKALLAAYSGDGDLLSLPSGESITAGEKLASAYGIAADTDPRIMENWSHVRMTVFLPTAIICAAVCVIWLISALHSVCGIYDMLEDLHLQCVSLAEDLSFTVTPKGETFGCVRRAYDGVILISQRLIHLSSCLEEEKSSLSEFLTDFTHQMKTSIAIIRLNSDLIAETKLSEERLEKLSDEISVNISKMEELTSSALKLAKLSANAVEYRLENSDLKSTCQAAIRRISPLLRQKNISLHFDNSGEEFPLVHDRIWLSEAVENIIKNCADHSECRDITVSLSRTPVSTTIAIEDNGKGIPQEDIPHLFERFGKKSSSTSMSSVGVGMSIAKKITDANGGEIIVYSAEGKGTRFELVFI